MGSWLLSASALRWTMRQTPQESVCRAFWGTASGMGVQGLGCAWHILIFPVILLQLADLTDSWVLLASPSWVTKGDMTGPGKVVARTLL